MAAIPKIFESNKDLLDALKSNEKDANELLSTLDNKQGDLAKCLILNGADPKSAPDIVNRLNQKIRELDLGIPTDKFFLEAYKKERTPLGHCMSLGWEARAIAKLATLLLENGAIVDLPLYEKTPFQRLLENRSVNTKNGRIALAQLLIDHGDSLDAPLLDYAAFRVHDEVVTLLLSQGQVCTPWTLYQILRCEYPRDHRKKRKILEKVVTSLSENGLTNAIDEEGRRPLCVAANEGSLLAIQLLLSAGADVCGVDGNGKAPIHVAKDRAAFHLLLHRGADLEQLDREGRSPAHCAASNIDYASLKLLLDKNPGFIDGVDYQGNTLLLSALGLTYGYKAQIQVVRLLLESGVDVYRANAKGDTPWKKAPKKNNKVHELLKLNGAMDQETDTAPTRSDAAARAPLDPRRRRFMFQGGISQSKQKLNEIEKKAKQVVRDAYDKEMSPLHFACKTQVPPKVIEQLIRWGASPTVRDQYGLIPCQYLADDFPRDYLQELDQLGIQREPQENTAALYGTIDFLVNSFAKM